jgi:predicted MPP superfamily phosphohydrolase
VIAEDETLLWSWLHLSDIHFEHGDAAYRADQRLVLKRLQQDLTKYAIPASITPKAILVTGDIAFSGGMVSDTEFQQAADYLATIRTAIGAPVELLTVPGNHDVQRTSDLVSEAGRLITELRGRKRGKVDEAAQDPEQAALLVDRFAHYSEFARQAGAADPDPIFWHHIVNPDSGPRIHVLGVNSALLANDDKDQLKLGVVRARIDHALSDVDDDEIVMMLSHHPFSWLAAEDGEYLESRADNEVHVHLHGHVHQAANFGVRHGTGLGRVTIVAGAVHGDQPTKKRATSVAHRYSIAALIEKPDRSVELRVHMRKWIGRWTRDADNERPDTYALLTVREAPQIAESAKPAKPGLDESFDGIAIRASDKAEWLLPVRGHNGPELCPSVDADSRDRALMSPAGFLLAQQTGTTLSVASTDHLGTSTTQWPLPFELDVGATVIAIAEAGAHDAVIVVSSDLGTRLVSLDRDTGELGAERTVDERRARCAVVDKGRVLLATLDAAVATCPAFTGIVDVERLDAVSRGGSTLIQAIGRDRAGETAVFLILTSPRWKDISLLRKRDRPISAIGVDLLVAEPLVVGEALARTWRRKPKDAQVVTFDKWVRP